MSDLQARVSRVFAEKAKISRESCADDYIAYINLVYELLISDHTGPPTCPCPAFFFEAYGEFLRNDTTVHNAEDEAIIQSTLPRGHVNHGDMCCDVFLDTMRPTRDAPVVVEHCHAAIEARATQRNTFVENFLLRPRLSKIVERWQCSAFAASMTRLRRRFSVPCHEQWTPASSKISLLSKFGHPGVACDWSWMTVV